jgi:hypothetical protein
MLRQEYRAGRRVAWHKWRLNISASRLCGVGLGTSQVGPLAGPILVSNVAQLLGTSKGLRSLRGARSALIEIRGERRGLQRLRSGLRARFGRCRPFAF